jgi:hypothetical protein
LGAGFNMPACLNTGDIRCYMCGYQAKSYVYSHLIGDELSGKHCILLRPHWYSLHSVQTRAACCWLLTPISAVLHAALQCPVSTKCPAH